MPDRLSRREMLASGAVALAAAASDHAHASERRAEVTMAQQDARELKIGIVGCAEGTHGKVWGEMVASAAGKRFGMRPARVWDADPAAAAALARTTGAEAVQDFREAGHDVDGVLIAELLPARYLELARPFLEVGQRVFLNRPFAGSVSDAKHILRIAREHNGKVYSASALFHTVAAQKAREKLKDLGQVRLLNVTGPTDNLGFYLPHAIAAMVSVLDTGVSKVQAVSLQPSAANSRLAAGPVVAYLEYGESSGHMGARGVVEMIGPGAKWYAFVMKLFGTDAESEEIHFEVSYDMLLMKMAEFFRTGAEPVPHEVLLEKTAIYYAVLQSAHRGGRAVSVSELIKVS